MNTQSQPKYNGDLLLLLFVFVGLILGAIGYGLIEIADLLAITITKHTAVTNPAIALVISWFSMFVFAIATVICSVYGYRKSVQKRKHREFLDANPDLNARAIYKTVRHMQRRTTYPNIRFGTVGNALENAGRYGAAKITDPFTLEVVKVYRHFLNPKHPLPESYRPR